MISPLTLKVWSILSLLIESATELVTIDMCTISDLHSSHLSLHLIFPLQSRPKAFHQVLVVGICLDSMVQENNYFDFFWGLNNAERLLLSKIPSLLYY